MTNRFFLITLIFIVSWSFVVQSIKTKEQIETNPIKTEINETSLINGSLINKKVINTNETLSKRNQTNQELIEASNQEKDPGHRLELLEKSNYRMDNIELTYIFMAYVFFLVILAGIGIIGILSLIGVSWINRRRADGYVQVP